MQGDGLVMGLVKKRVKEQGDELVMGLLKVHVNGKGPSSSMSEENKPDTLRESMGCM